MRQNVTTLKSVALWRRVGNVRPAGVTEDDEIFAVVFCRFVEGIVPDYVIHGATVRRYNSFAP
ncbi:hypothetical protein PT2222_220113 [Paraburkholderia tropica]